MLTSCLQDELQRHKYRYCIHKDEFVIGIGRPWASDAGRKRTNNAYPRVISNLGQLDLSNDGAVPIKMIRYMYHYARSLREKQDIIKWFKVASFNHGAIDSDGNSLEKEYKAFTDEEKECIPRWLPIMADQIAVGYANTLGWAHPNTGDTMVTVMIGGLRTVMNGDFEVFPGDLIQWYWPFEKDCFKSNGERKKYVEAWFPNERERHEELPNMLPPNVMPEFDVSTARSNDFSLDGSAARRKTFYDRGFGNVSEKQAKLVARVKPYIRDDENPRIFDTYRVFAVAIAAARPHEMLDIKISRQSV